MDRLLVFFLETQPSLGPRGCDGYKTVEINSRPHNALARLLNLAGTLSFFCFLQNSSVVLGIQVLSKYSTTELHSRSYLISLSKWK